MKTTKELVRRLLSVMYTVVVFIFFGVLTLTGSVLVVTAICGDGDVMQMVTGILLVLLGMACGVVLKFGTFWEREGDRFF